MSTDDHRPQLRRSEDGETSFVPEREDELALELHVHQVELETQNRELREAQGLLEQSRAHYTDLYDFAPVPYFTLSRAGLIQNLNLLGAALMGRDRGYLIGRPLGLIVPTRCKGSFFAHLLECIDGAARVTTRLELELPERGALTVQLVSAPFEGTDGRPASCRTAVFDVSALEQAQREREELLVREREAREAAESNVRELRRVQSELREALRSRDAFLAIASHELKTPLTALSLKLERLRKDAEGVTDARRSPECLLKSTDVLSRQVRRLTALVNGLLDVSRVSTGELDLQLREVDLVPLVRGLKPELEAECAAARCALTIDNHTPSAIGHWDPLRLEQVVTNLVSNAVKYGAGKPIQISVGREDAVATLSVTDDGIGVDPADVGRIFQRFERAVSPHHFGGLGLGLYVCKQIVTALHGDIEVRSQPGAGATFAVRLPLAD